MEPLDLNAVARTGLILAHLLAFSLAAVGVAFGDYAIFRTRRVDVDVDMLATAGRVVIVALATLWITGLAVLWLDTGLDPSVLLTKPKLLAKLTVAVALSINGYFLHRVAFPRFAVAQDDPHAAATLPTILGAISASTWLFAAFLGVAKTVAPALGYVGFPALYGAVVSLAIAVSLAVIRPRLAARMIAQAGPLAVAADAEPTDRADVHPTHLGEVAITA